MRSLRIPAGFLLLTAFVVGCTDQLPTQSSDLPLSDSPVAAVSGDAVMTSPLPTFSHVPAHAGINQQLAALRRTTASFHNFDKAAAAGYGQITDCIEQLPDGAQGIHYGNFAFFGDGVVSLLEPEIVQYEPQANGRLRLVGVEYVVLLDFDKPGPLFGQEFHANEDAGVWALHVWLWRHNPSGMFEDWNPKVSCEHA